MNNPFRYFNSSPEIIRLTVMMYIRYPLSLRQVEDLLFERGIDICHETVRFWWNRFGPMFAAEIRKRRVQHRCYSRWQWHLDEVFVRMALSEQLVCASFPAPYFLGSGTKPRFDWLQPGSVRHGQATTGNRSLSH